MYKRLYKHLLSDQGNILIRKGLEIDGLNNFIYGVLEYYPNKVKRENNDELFALEISYISLLTPTYNMLLLCESGENFGLKNKEININNKLNLNKLSLLKERQNLLLNIKEKHKLDLKYLSNINKESKHIYLSKEIISNLDILNGNYICKLESVNKAANYLCCSTKTISRSLDIGVIYVPNMFEEYLDNKYIDNNLLIKNLIDKNDKFNKLRASLVESKDFVKFYITIF